jgi:hypothetical protein
MSLIKALLPCCLDHLPPFAHSLIRLSSAINSPGTNIGGGFTCHQRLAKPRNSIMEPVGAIASVITLVALAKEISAIANDLIRSFRNAPKEVVQSCNQISLDFLELSCIDQMQQEGTLESLLTADESRTLIQSLSIAKNNITAIYKDVEECTQVKAGKSLVSSRLSWALFDRKTTVGSLEQLQRTESRLLFIL